MPRILKRFFAWIGSLMRRRHFVATTRVTPAPPPPVDINTAILILLALEEL